MSAKKKIINYLSKSKGENTLTVAQARARFGIRNVSARIEELRSEGHCIYTNKKVLSDGRSVTYYKLGKPNKEMIAAAHAVFGADIFA
jgi:ribonucleotide monophosphatase NagD (HAD superfamily)